MYFKHIRFGLALSGAMLCFAAVGGAQPVTYLWDNGGGNFNWGTDNNWGLNPPLNLGVNNVTPNAYYEEMGLINNGNTVNVTTHQTQFNDGSSPDDTVVAAAGVTVDGVTATGNGSTLNIASTGALTLMITYGSPAVPPYPAATPSAGTGNATVNNLGKVTIQPGGTLTVQGNTVINSGTVTVGGGAAGGTLNTNELNEFSTSSNLNLQGSAVVNVTGGALLNGVTTITGPNVVFNAGGIGMNANTVFSPVISNAANANGTGHSVIGVNGGVSVNGTIKPSFSGGVTPHLGDTWTLFDAGQIQGTFAVSDATGTGATLPTGLRYALTTTKTGAVHGIKGQLTVENYLSAQVDRSTGEVKILNTDTSVGPGVTITGYQIGSAGGALKTSAFHSAFGGTIGDYNSDGAVNAADYTVWRDHLGQSFALPNRDPANTGTISAADYTSWKSHFGGSGSSTWQTANLTANSVAELNPTSSSTVGLNASASLGNIYDPVSLETAFGTTPVSDLTFSYTRSDGRTVSAPLNYVNTGLANTLVLQVDPTNGKAKIVNDSVFNNVKIDGYYVTSASNSLLTTNVAGWNSLQNQGIAGGTWQEANPTTAALSELNPTTNSTINAGQTLATMTGFFKVGGTQDLAFQFRVPGTGAGTGVINGVVRYVSIPGSGSGSAVPEPSSLVLLGLGGILAAVFRRPRG
jgi:hypothetical protein